MHIARSVVFLVALIGVVPAQQDAGLQEVELWYRPATSPALRFPAAAPTDAMLVDRHLAALRRDYERLAPGGGGLFTGYAGSLDGAGVARLGIAVPGLPPLVGLELTHLGVVWVQGAPTLAAVSPALRSRIVP